MLSFCHLILQSFKWWECSTSKKLMLNTFVSSLFSFHTSWFKQFKLLPSQRWQNYSAWAHLCCLRQLSPNNRIENLHQRLYSSQYFLSPCTEKACWNFLFFFLRDHSLKKYSWYPQRKTFPASAWSVITGQEEVHTSWPTLSAFICGPCPRSRIQANNDAPLWHHIPYDPQQRCQQLARQPWTGH